MRGSGGGRPAVWGTSFALDKTIQSGAGHMAHSALDVMENLSYTMLITAACGTLMYGLYRDESAARQNADASIGRRFGSRDQ